MTHENQCFEFWRFALKRWRFPFWVLAAPLFSPQKSSFFLKKAVSGALFFTNDHPRCFFSFGPQFRNLLLNKQPQTKKQKQQTQHATQEQTTTTCTHIRNNRWITTTHLWWKVVHLSKVLQHCHSQP